MGLLETGSVVRDTYEVERFMGQGAFAEVYRVKHRFLGRQAMKVFKRTGMSLEEIHEMLNEAILLSRIGHPNIVRVFDANVLDTPHGTCGYFTMENVPGGSLEKFWHSHGGKFVPLETTIDLMKQVCRGLSLAHQEDPPIVHRDIKPQNILVGYEADGIRARISDFGLAKKVNPLTLMATAAGTLAFKPPEAFKNPKGDSCAADVWALGTTLYLLLTDRLPYEFPEGAGWGAKHVFDKNPAPPSQVNREVDDALESIVMKAIERRPKDRFHNAQGMLDALQRWSPNPAPLTAPNTHPSSEASKTTLGTVTPADQDAASSLVEKAFAAAAIGRLVEAGDLMEEAFNRWPELREKHATRLKLWRKGICM